MELHEMSDLRLTETGNVGPVTELERRRIAAIELMQRERIKHITQRACWEDKRDTK